MKSIPSLESLTLLVTKMNCQMQCLNTSVALADSWKLGFQGRQSNKWQGWEGQKSPHQGAEPTMPCTTKKSVRKHNS